MKIPWIGMEIDDEIGSGSYGRVYCVYLDDEEYALKVIRIPQDESETDILLKTMGSLENVKKYYHSKAEAFLMEIRFMQNLLGNPYIVSIKDYRLVEEETGYTLYILMELLQSFADYEVEHQIDEKRAIEIGIDLCNALMACEENHVIHRDLKPDNILVDENGTCKICDFGVAKNMEKTMANWSIKGTFSFMAPEVYHGKDYDNRADIYSLGMILHRLLNRGRDPLIDPEASEIRFKDKEAAINKRMEGEALPAPIDASPELSEVILKACAFYKEDRYPTAGKMKEDLLKVKEGRYKSVKRKKYGKLTSKDILKNLGIAFAILFICCFITYKGVDIYKDHQRLYDSTLKKQYEEDYYKGTGKKYDIQAYVDGHGTLFIFDDRDLINNLTEYYYGDNYTFDDTYDELSEYIWDYKKTDIKKIVFSDEVEYIPFGAFSNYINLEEVVLPSHIESIGSGAFASCPKLRSILHASTIKELGEGCFTESEWIKQKKDYLTLGNCLIKYNGEKELVDDIPKGIDLIAEHAFEDNKNIKTVILPDGISRLGEGAFNNCDNLTMIHMPQSIREIGYGLFAGCKSLHTIEMDFDWRSVNFLSAPRRIFGDTPWAKEHSQNGYVIDKNVLLFYLMDNENDYKTIADDIPENVTVIGSAAFQDEYDLHIKKIIFPSTVKIIMREAFNNNSSLEEVVLPDGLEELGSDAFTGCPRLRDISYKGDLKNIKISGNPFNGSKFEVLHTKDGYFTYQNILFGYRGDKKIIDDIPETVYIIKEGVFSGTDAKKIIIPDSVIKIENVEFMSCENLEELIISKSVKEIGEDLCTFCDKLKEIRVPDHFTDEELKKAFPKHLDKIVKY